MEGLIYMRMKQLCSGPMDVLEIEELRTHCIRWGSYLSFKVCSKSDRLLYNSLVINSACLKSPPPNQIIVRFLSHLNLPSKHFPLHELFDVIPPSLFGIPFPSEHIALIG